MSLKSQLTISILAVTFFLIIFFSIIGASLKATETFISEDLFREVNIARYYETLVSNWVNLPEPEKIIVSLEFSPENLLPESELNKLRKGLLELDGLIINTERKNAFQRINQIFEDHVIKIRTLEKLLIKRNGIAKNEKLRRLEKKKFFEKQVQTLLDGFKRMIDDLSKTLRQPDFQLAIGNTANLMLAVSKMERDLLIAQSDVSKFLFFEDENSFKNFEIDRSDLDDRIEKRLRAVIDLLGKSLEVVKNPVQFRVFSRIKTNVQSFRKSFDELKELLEQPETERLEMDDEIKTIITELKLSNARLIKSANFEANFYWEKISKSSENLLNQISFDLKIGGLFFLFTVITGFWISFFYPGKVAKPLIILNKEMAHFNIGEEPISQPISNILEIDELRQSFFRFIERLNFTAQVNAKYIEAIKEMGDVFIKLHESPPTPDNTQPGLEYAVNHILEKLIESVSGIDIAKVMLRFPTWTDQEDSKTPVNGQSQKNPPSGWYKLGETYFSGSFLKNPEFQIYVDSRKSISKFEEFIPDGDGLIGNPSIWEISLPTSGGESKDSFSKKIPLFSLSKAPTFTDRNFEKGINGCLHLIWFFRKIMAGNSAGELESNLEVGNYDKENVFGALFIYFSDPEMHLSQQDLSFIEIMGLQISILIESNILLQVRERQHKTEEQLALAREIQENLLPKKIPNIESLHIAAISKPAFEVGGDYYDFFKIAENRIGIVIADAAGKNVPAAIIMTVFKSVLSTFYENGEMGTLGPEQILEKANRIILKNITPDRFITCMFLIIDSTNGHFEYACAGQPAILIKGKSLIEIAPEATDFPLGIFDMPYKKRYSQLEPNQGILLYTDGITEARNRENKEFGISRLKSFLARYKGKDLANNLTEHVESFIGECTPHDDITAVSIFFLGRKS
ncbi:MAG: PP2C family protein-serine/threonine phosphatase [Candidatus Riflebacteria bacterium]|nr:PP2C family protein-serine/threonine phosphatase [Candidatus Riflebacteria bacterium]